MNLARAIGSQWVATAYVAGVSVALCVFLGRMLGPEGFGRYSYLLTIASLYAVIQGGGFQILCFREQVASTSLADASIDQIVPVSLGYLAVATLLGIAVAAIVPMKQSAGLALSIFCLGLTCAAQMVSSVLKGKGLFEKEAMWNIRVKTFSAGAIVVFVLFTAPTAETVFIGWSIGLLLAFWQKGCPRMIAKPSFSFRAFSLWRSCVFLLIIQICTTLYFRVDIILLKHFQDDLAVVGNYSAAYQILEGVLLFLAPVVNIAFLHLRRSWRERELFFRKFKIIMLAMAIFGLFFIAAGFLLGPWAIGVAYGKDYALARSLLPVIFLSTIFIFPNLVMTQSMIALNCEKYYAAAAFAAALFNILLNCALIPKYGAFGAAWATAATEALLTLFCGIKLLRKKSLKFDVRCSTFDA